MTFRQYALLPEGKDSALIGLSVGALSFPDGVELVSVHREGIIIELNEKLCLGADDQLTLLGPSEIMPSLGEPLPIQESIE